MKQEKVKMYRRVIAYVVDFIIVVILSTLILNVLPFNEKYNTTVNNSKALQEMVLKKEITNDAYLKESINLTYDSYKYGTLENGVTILVMILYFTLFAYFNHGRTPGKMLMRIEVKDKEGNDPPLFASLIRTIFITRVFGDILTLILVYSMKKPTFAGVYKYVDMAISIIWISCPFIALFREDGRGLHDLIAGTVVLSKRKPMENEVVEAQIEEKKEEIKEETKKKDTTKKTNNNKKKNNKKK